MLYIFVFLLFAFYGYLAISGRTQVKAVEAGPTDTKNASYFRKKSYYVHKDRLNILPNGEKFNDDKYFLVKVDGNCLKPKGINNGKLLCVEKFSNQEIKQGNVIVLYIADKGFGILRIVDSIEGDTVRTFNYDDRGNRHDSSRPHRLSQVKGIVKYKLN